jgi:hypothetical protein
VTALPLYQLTNTIIEELRPQATSRVKLGADGKYYWRNMPTDTPIVRLLLQDRPYSHTEVEEFVLMKKGPNYSKTLLEHFKLADVQYMQRQLPAMRQFKLDPSRVNQNWVAIIPYDTISQDYKQQIRRLGHADDISHSDSFFHRYGSMEVFCISGMLFSEDKKMALVRVDFGYGFNMCLYKKGPRGWYRETILYTVVA